MSRKKGPHLSVVWSTNIHSPLRLGLIEPKQLSLEFSEKERLITCIEDKQLSASKLISVLSSLKPYYLLDLRSCPRFDFLGYSRKKAFADFERWNTKYFCLTTQEAAQGVRERSQMIISKLRSKNDHVTGPFVVLVETLDTVEEFRRALPPPEDVKWDWSILIEGSSDILEQSPRLYAV
jgi:hypothetical protein